MSAKKALARWSVFETKQVILGPFQKIGTFQKGPKKETSKKVFGTDNFILTFLRKISFFLL